MTFAKFLSRISFYALDQAFQLDFYSFLFGLENILSPKETSAEIPSFPRRFNFTNLAVRGGGVFHVKVLFSPTFTAFFVFFLK